MKLSRLIAYRNALANHSVDSIHFEATHRLKEIIHDVEINKTVLPVTSDHLVSDMQEISASFNKFNGTLETLQKHLNDLIELTEKSYFVESYRLYEEEMCYETVEYILNRRMPISPETEHILHTRIKSYSDWRYPGMIIRPGLDNFIDQLVGLDPLYIVDKDYGLLEPSMDKFPTDYQRRIRPYVITESADEDILNKIPDDQFGFCLAFNFFEFKPFEIFRRYLNEIYSKLRPGGILALTFNDCDRPHCVALVEASYTCYTPGKLVRSLAQSIGYEEMFFWNDNGNLSWLELRKPGELTSLRGGQTLAKIKPISLAKSK